MSTTRLDISETVTIDIKDDNNNKQNVIIVNKGVSKEKLEVASNHTSKMTETRDGSTYLNASSTVRVTLGEVKGDLTIEI